MAILEADRDVMLDRREDFEPHLVALLDAKRARQGRSGYKPRKAQDVAERLGRLLGAHGVQGHARNVRRMGGGASKEQFLFDLVDPASGATEQLVLRMDPLEGIVETSREREAQLIEAIGGTVPAPSVAFVDSDGRHMGQPAMITRFVRGDTKPRDATSGPSGVGIVIGERASAALIPQYLDNLVAIHGFDFARADLATYAVPQAGTTQAALWQLNFWERVLEDDQVEASPLLTYTACWLRERAPVCDAPVLLHGDYRLGNFMFDEDTLEMTAVLDWELAHIGDVHEDISYSLEPLFCSRDAQGRPLVASMMPVPAFLDGYAERSGRTIDPTVLHWYQVLNSFKLSVMNFASGVRAARDGTNHQSAFLGYLAACHVGLSGTLCHLLEGYGA
ncbi:phosphotransferase family protein [Novosphingobium lentum]|uniref:phosphotransferase family protein n=1 Tax=Novosphingobium lentum TaxID=145287 RepID=UPI000A6C6D82|nr:phosphotransferase family protein [Novosphingobium lentum]